MRSAVFDRLLNNFDGFILSLTFRSFKRFRRANLLLLEMWPFEAILKQMHFTAKPFPSMSLTSGAYLLFLYEFAVFILSGGGQVSSHKKTFFP